MKLKKILSVITVLSVMTAAMSLGTVGVLAAEDSAEYKYYNGTEWATGTKNATALEATSTEWSTGWYAVDADLTISDRITVTGDVHLILKDGTTLTANGGIRVEGTNSLSVYGQSLGTGVLNAKGGYHAGIGGNWGAPGNSASQNPVDGSYSGTATDGSQGGSAGIINIYGGTVNASADYGAAVGGGSGGSGGSYQYAVVNNYSGAGNGGSGGKGGNGGTVTVYGGVLTASAGYGAAIGGGYGGMGGDTVGSGNEPGNGGDGGDGGSLTVYGGTLSAKSSSSIAIGNSQGDRWGNNNSHGGYGNRGNDGSPATIHLLGGAVTAVGHVQAMNGVPDVSGYADAQIIGSTSMNNASPEAYAADKSSTYKHIMISDTPVIVVGESSFPDADFRTWVLSQSYGADNVLTEAERASVEEIDVKNKGIADLTGIEYFTALTILNCSENSLTELDISKNTALKVLDCHSNKLTALDISQNTALEEFTFHSNSFMSFDLSALSELTAVNGGDQAVTVDGHFKNRYDMTKYDGAFDSTRATITSPMTGASFSGNVLELDEGIGTVEYTYKVGCGNEEMSVTLTVGEINYKDALTELDGKLNDAIAEYGQAMAELEGEKVALEAKDSELASKNAELEAALVAANTKADADRAALEDANAALSGQLEAAKAELNESITAGDNAKASATVAYALLAAVGVIALAGNAGWIIPMIKKKD